MTEALSTLLMTLDGKAKTENENAHVYKSNMSRLDG